MRRKGKAASPVAAATGRAITIDGRMLAELRDLLGVANRKPKGAFGVPYRSLSGYENGKRTPPRETVALLFRSMRERARQLDAQAGCQGGVISETSFIARVQAGQRQIAARALDRELTSGLGSDLDAESLLREWLDDPSPEGQALHDSFVGLAERANLTLDAQLSTARLRVAELLRAQGRNWLRNSHFVEAAKPLREALQYAPASLEDKLVLVRALLPQSQRPDDGIGKEIAALHSDICCETGTSDWIDLQVSIGKTAFHYRDLAGAEAAFRLAKEAGDEGVDQSRFAEPLGHLAVVLYQQAEPESCPEIEREQRRDQAMEHWERVLSCLPESNAHQRAVTHLRLGNFWLQRPIARRDERNDLDERRANLKHAYRHYEAARQIWERQGVASYLGAIQYTLADWELQRAKLCDDNSEKKAHLDEAVKLSKDAMRKLTPDARDDWHNSHFNLAEAFVAQDALHNDDELLHDAINAYQIAADVYANGRNVEFWKATMLPLCRVKAQLLRRNSNDRSTRDALLTTLAELAAKLGDDANVQEQLAAYSKEFSLDLLPGHRLMTANSPTS